MQWESHFLALGGSVSDAYPRVQSVIYGICGQWWFVVLEFFLEQSCHVVSFSDRVDANPYSDLPRDSGTS